MKLAIGNWQLVMKGIVFMVFLVVWPMILQSQAVFVSGDVLDEKGQGMGYATVALLNPSDSTLAFFAITGANGHFEIRNTKAGAYLLQVAYVGYKPFYRKVSIQSGKSSDFGAIIMKPAPVNLGEVEVTSDHIPLLIKKDTIEYNAAAFKTKPDAVVEDLLRKLPGVEVDRTGNIKAVGEDVRNVLVDGKEFFGNNPKVATRNVPADAVKKVQVYDKMSDESEFTGINDGTHEKTMNLVLKEDKKKALFGDVMAGAGTGQHYQGSAKAYRFTGSTQFAALAMVNNINQTGFSFSDYLSFNGGLGAITSGGGTAQITTENDYPVNFGQQVVGKVASGAAGLNFSREFRKNNRFNISYLGNASEVLLDQDVYSQNFVPEGSFVTSTRTSSDDINQSHRITFGWKNRIDSLHNLTLSGGLSLSSGDGSGRNQRQSFRNDSLVNSQEGENSDDPYRFSGNIRASFLRKLNQNKTNLKLSGNAAYSFGLNSIQWQNLTHYYNPPFDQETAQYQETFSDRLNTGMAIKVTQSTGKGTYLEPFAEAGFVSEWLNRKQGFPSEAGQFTDSLSPVFSTRYISFGPAMRFRKSGEKTKFSVTARSEYGRLESTLNNEPDVRYDRWYLLPAIDLEYEYVKGRRLAFSYISSVVAPTANQLLPVVNNINPLALAYGNQSLTPEYRHDIRANWWLFDQFSFTTLLTSASFGYVKNKISWSQQINDSLGQTLMPVNVPDDYSAGVSADFSTPVRKIGLTLHASLREDWNRGITRINGKENINTNLTHRITLSFDNRKKEKWDLNFGVAFTLTNAWYSIQEQMNYRYFDLGYFGDLRFTPDEQWSFEINADVTNYNAESFTDLVSVPLLGAGITFSFLKNNRGLLTLTGFDLLNKNTGIERVSEMNYLRETRSSIIGRYVMLSFKYRLNKFKEASGLDIRINNRR